jgi:hypothetical protein
MKLLCTLLVLLGTVAAPAAAYASETEAYCYVPPITVNAAGHSASTPSVTVPCPQGTP